jgi:hypothetical protein
MTGQDRTGQGITGQDTSGQDKTRQDETRQDVIGQESDLRIDNIHDKSRRKTRYCKLSDVCSRILRTTSASLIYI